VLQVAAEQAIEEPDLGFHHLHQQGRCMQPKPPGQLLKQRSKLFYFSS
jgi:hypothetical protein